LIDQLPRSASALLHPYPEFNALTAALSSNGARNWQLNVIEICSFRSLVALTRDHRLAHLCIHLLSFRSWVGEFDIPMAHVNELTRNGSAVVEGGKNVVDETLDPTNFDGGSILYVGGLHVILNFQPSLL
jgi:hypothetical protein